MKNFQNDNVFRRLAIVAAIVFVFAQTPQAQQLKPKEIIYSRLQTNLLATPTGANSPTIWVVGQDGANDRQITTGLQPRISDDGRYLLFKRFPGTANNPFGNPWGGEGQLWVRDLANNSETMIFSWGSSGYMLGYYFSPESNLGNYQIILSYITLTYKMNIDGTGAVAIPGQLERDRFPVVRRGDSQIASHAQDGNGLATLTPDTAVRTVIPNTVSNDFNPSWSNDNQFIGFGSIFPANLNPYNVAPPYPYVFGKLNKIKPDGTGRSQLADLTANNTNGFTFGTIWAEDNSKIITAARVNGVAGLYAFSTDGSGTLTQIPISNGNAPDWVGGIVQPREEQQVVSVGGGVANNGNYSLVSTFGEVVGGQNSSGGSYSFDSGFWASFQTPKKSLFDFDGDGKTDISIFRPSVGEWWYSRSTDGQVPAVQFGTSSDRPVPADFTGDGKTDVAFWRPSTGDWYVLRSDDGTFFSFPFGANGDVPVVGDFDADGKADPAVFRPSNSTWYISKSSGGTTITTFGTAGDRPVAADYDGDGKTDVAIFRPSDGSWWYVRSSDNQFRVFSFGLGSDKCVPGDYTGDGKADIAIFRPSTGEWFVQRSEDNSYFSFPFGAAGDVPVPGDYDGDGRFDSAVFRTSSSTWFVNRTTSGILIANFGVAGDRPIPNVFVP